MNISKGHKMELESAVGIVLCNGKILVGLANADDERDGKWCFPGGGIEDGEDCLSAAIREVYEEVGLVTQPLTELIITHPIKPKVGFCLLTCSVEDVDTLSCNEEFEECNWVTLQELPTDTLPINTKILNSLLSLVNKNTSFRIEKEKTVLSGFR